MARKPDFLRKQIKSTLVPVLARDGFRLYRQKDFVRVRGAFVDQISFQLSRHGSREFYVHYCTGLISDPLLDLASYTVGERLSNNPDASDDTPWRGATDGGAQLAIESVAQAYRGHISEWFESTDSTPMYIYRYLLKNRRGSLESLEFAVAFLEAGEKGRAWWICSDLLENASDLSDQAREACQELVNVEEAAKMKLFLTDEKYAESRKEFGHRFRDLELPQVQYDSLSDLMAHWKSRNIERFGLVEFTA